MVPLMRMPAEGARCVTIVPITVWLPVYPGYTPMCVTWPRVTVKRPQPMRVPDASCTTTARPATGMAAEMLKSAMLNAREATPFASLV